MKNILMITSSVKGSESISTRLANTIATHLQETYPGSTLTVHDLATNPIPHLSGLQVQAFFSAETTPETLQATAVSDNAIAALQQADIIILAVAYYNFSIPSTLKAWIDHVVRAGKTFSYADGSPKGFIQNKKAYLAIAYGGIYSEGPMKDIDVDNYLRQVLGFIGITDVTTFRAEGSMYPATKDTFWDTAVAKVQAYAF